MNKNSLILIKIFMIMTLFIILGFGIYYFVWKEDVDSTQTPSGSTPTPSGSTPTPSGSTPTPLSIYGNVVTIKDNNNNCIAVQDTDNVVNNGDDVRLEPCVWNRPQHLWTITNDTQNNNGVTYRRIQSMVNPSLCLDYDGAQRQGGMECIENCGAYEVRTCSDSNDNHYFHFVNGDVEGTTKIKRRAGNQECLHYSLDNNTFGKISCDTANLFNVERRI